MMKKRNRIVSKLKLKYWDCTHKYILRIPKSVKDKISLDRVNGNTIL